MDGGEDGGMGGTKETWFPDLNRQRLRQSGEDWVEKSGSASASRRYTSRVL